MADNSSGNLGTEIRDDVISVTERLPGKRDFLSRYALLFALICSVSLILCLILGQNHPGFPATQVAPTELVPSKETASSTVSGIADETRRVTLTIGGDVMFDTFIYNWISANGIDYPWDDVAEFFLKADIAAVNFESSSSLRGASTKPVGYGFCSPPHTLQSLVNTGIDYVSLGNNHVLDFGVEAFGDTLNNLSALDIVYSGAGDTFLAAEAPAFLERNGLKIGFLSYTAIIPHSGWRPGEVSPGVAPLYYEEDIARALKNISAYKTQCDILIVLPHWGVEYADAPTEAQRDLAQRMIDAGADLILGGHPHVLQGVEFYNGKPIFYSLGNFIFLKMDDNAGKTAVFELILDQNGFVSCQLHPVFIDSCKANLLSEDHWMHGEILERFARLSAALGAEVQQDGRIEAPRTD